MSRLVLVRHAQATAFDADSDRLSELGLRQSARLADYWSQQGVVFDRIVTGTLKRHQETAAVLAGRERTVDARWDEFDSEGLLARLAPMLAARDAAFRQALERFHESRRGPEANRNFQAMFEALATRWAAGELAAPEVETWPAFQQRVREALEQVLGTGGRGRSILVVTSAGPIATVVQTILQAPAAVALELAWRMRNASITEVLFSRGRISLDCFNATPHLEPGTVTYR